MSTTFTTYVPHTTVSGRTELRESKVKPLNETDRKMLDGFFFSPPSRKTTNCQKAFRITMCTAAGAGIGGTVGSGIPVIGTGIGIALGAVGGAIFGFSTLLQEPKD